MYQWEKINLFLFRFVLTGFGVVIANQMNDAHSNFSSSLIMEWMLLLMLMLNILVIVYKKV